MGTKLTMEELSDGVVRYYVANLKACSLAQLADFLSVPVRSVRAVARTEHGLVPGCSWTEVEIERRSRNYGNVIGYCTVDALEPNLSTLARLIRAQACVETER